jgi:phospholipid-translocating ATPase
VATFLPKSLFEQFRRVASIYFLAYTKLAPYDSSTAIGPLVIVILATMLKEAIEDWRRYQQVRSTTLSSCKLLSD